MGNRISEYFLWLKERKKDEFWMVKIILLLHDTYFPFFDFACTVREKIEAFEPELKIEIEKDYSYRKEEIANEIFKLQEVYVKNIYHYIDNIYYKYYDCSGNDFLEDMDICIEYMQQSKWWSIQHVNLFNSIKNLFKKSSTVSKMDELVKQFQIKN